MSGPSYDYLEKFIKYNSEDGSFLSLWTGKRKYLRVNNKTGYAEITVGKVRVYAHRLAWFLSYREWPEQLDHINGNKLDNRLCNLRLATNEQNAQNRRFSGRYLSKCIYFDPTHPSKKKYRVRVQAGGIRRHIGWFLTEQEAKDAAIKAITSFHGEFSVINT